MTDDLASRCLRALDQLPGAAAFSHGTAAALQRLPVPVGPAHRRLDAVVPRGLYIAPHCTVAVHERETPLDTTLVGVLPVTTPLRTWLDLAPSLDHVDAVVLGDAVARLLGSTEPLMEAVRVHGAGRGATRVRAAAGDVRLGAATPDETRLRLLAREAGLPEPVLGVHVGGRVGRVPLGWPGVALAVRLGGVPAGVQQRVVGRWRVLTLAPWLSPDQRERLRGALRAAFLGQG